MSRQVFNRLIIVQVEGGPRPGGQVQVKAFWAGGQVGKSAGRSKASQAKRDAFGKWPCVQGNTIMMGLL